MDQNRPKPLAARITAVVVALIGLYLTGGGMWLVILGGSPYYVATGIALLVTAILLWQNHSGALWLYAVILLGSILWGLWEAGLNFWALAPRGDILVPLGIWLLVLPFITRSIPPMGRGAPIALGAVVVLSLIVVVAALLTPSNIIAGTAPMTTAANPVPGAESSDDWTDYGGTSYGGRFSALTQITPENVKNLKLAWEFRTGDLKGSDDPVEITNEDTPIKVGDMLYACSAHQIAYALDAATGKLRWKYDPQVKRSTGFQHMTCRGVAFHRTPPNAQTIEGQPAPTDCPSRVFLPTNDGRMIALDGQTGQPCQGFGDHGVVNLLDGEPFDTPGFYEATSPPVATEKVLIVGGAVIDNWSSHVPSGAIRGYDIYTGKLIWAFDAGNPDPNEMPSGDHKFTAGSANSWIVSSADEKLGLVYVPLGSPSDDQWGGKRSAEDERFDSAMVALDIATGKLRWSFQNVHHDLWDMDFPAQPSLADIDTPNGVIPAIYMPAKTGDIFVADRRDGHLIVPAPENPAPGGAAPGDHTAPTQPFSELSFRPRQPLTEAQMWGGTMFDQLACRIMFRSLRYEGPFTPPSTQGTLVFPGDLGMFEWGGIAIDPRHQIAVANPMSIPFISKLIPRGEDNPPAPTGKAPPGTELGTQPMYEAPYGVQLSAFLSPVGAPCLQPPWGNMAALDLKTNKVIWEHPVGTTRDVAPVPIALLLGVPMLGGPIVTAGGVAFLTGTEDYYIRAFDVASGRLLWQDRLPAGGQSTPMTYAVNGRQYVVTVDGGHGSFGTKMGDYIRAYALPAS
ncbi:MAG TPA: membrane-bound PQQ-dependent dehydrogenase, glucose/quinate/shikimate family [Rhodopila sp.]|nr:membrane-bound PQQ-dependent dehydrogenase, glucose/quinate/shikimate family [Rhodopila sp.]